MSESLINQADVAIICPQNRDISWILVADFRFSYDSRSRLDLLSKDLYPTVPDDLKTTVLAYLNRKRPEIIKPFSVAHRNFLFNPSYSAGFHLENLILGINRGRIDPIQIDRVFRNIRKDDDRRNLMAALYGDKYYLPLVCIPRCVLMI